jgi:hypothetical protein
LICGNANMPVIERECKPYAVKVSEEELLP